MSFAEYVVFVAIGILVGSVSGMLVWELVMKIKWRAICEERDRLKKAA
jgi:hypothetical protein